MHACIHLPDEPEGRAAELAASFSPHVESIDARTTVFSLTSRQIHGFFRDFYAKIPRIAIAAGIEAAVLAARNFPGCTMLEPGEEARVLGSLSIDALEIYATPTDVGIFRTLDAWGIHTLAELARLPDDGIAERLGARGLTLKKLACGALDRPLEAAIAEPVYEKSIELEYKIELLEPVLFLIGRFLRDLCERLDRQSMSASALRFTFNDEPRELRLPFPTRDVKFLLKLVQHDLEKHPLSQPLQKLKLRMIAADPRRVQHGLFTPAAPEPEKLELTLGKIRALVGAENVKTPELCDTYRPGWGEAESRLAFRYFRPALEARVETERGAPKRLWTRMFQGTVVKIAGPWRSSGDWFGKEWNRDEWDVAMPDGGLYRVVMDHFGLDQPGINDLGMDRARQDHKIAGTPEKGRWLVEGVYD